jgi:hypothetical protein
VATVRDPTQARGRSKATPSPVTTAVDPDIVFEP